ncbi:MAG: histidinol-phosphate transaminase [Gammaproteobacteria bacterium]|nr:histidinol-phosphate transaminase [Gammaproteobacteria bacterium]
MSRLWSANVHTLTPYVPGEQPKVENLIKLNTNESPYPPSPKVLEAIEQAAKSLRLYPDPVSAKLKQTLADYHQLTSDQIFVGNGSDEVLAHVFAAFFKQDLPLYFPDLTYSFYPVYAKLFEIETVTVELNAKFEIDPNDYQSPAGGVIFANPNAPTGHLLGLDAVRQIARQQPDCAVVVDEAYIDFGGQSAVALVNEFPNVLVVRTYSKSRALAGSRVGYAMGNSELIEGLNRVKDSFNSYPIDRLAEAAAVASVEDNDYFEACCEKVIAQREWLAAELSKLDFTTLPSFANFVLTEHATFDAKTIATKLRDQHIIVRYLGAARIENHLRISVGDEAQNQALINALSHIVQG